MWSASSRHARLCTVLTALRHWGGHREGWGDSALPQEGESWAHKRGGDGVTGGWMKRLLPELIPDRSPSSAGPVGQQSSWHLRSGGPPTQP